METLQISERKPEAFLKSENLEKGDAVRVSESTRTYVVIYVGSVTSAQPLFPQTSKTKS